MNNQSALNSTSVRLAVLAALYPGIQLLAQDGLTLEEIVVTATKREASIQDIAAQVQAISQETLADMGARNMEDFARFMPGLNVVAGVTDSTVVFRGAITGAGYIAASTSSVYLDELPLTTTGSQPNVRLVDIARVEALAGPQGTLYGSDAQAGTMRIVTNKPVMGERSTTVDTEVRGFSTEGDASFRTSLVFNTPLNDSTALRVSLFNDKDGGFIDNVLGHTADSAMPAFGGGKWPVNYGELDNSKSIEDNANFAKIKGGRAEIRWEINDKWATNLSAMHQETSQGSGNYYDEFRGDLNIVSFHDDWYESEWDAFALTVEGDLGFAQLVAAASYYERSGKGVWDITNYAHYWSKSYCSDSYYTSYYYPYYYANPSTGMIGWYPVYCQGTEIDNDFFSSYQGTSDDDKFAAEIRLSSQGDTYDWIVGLYLEDATDHWTAPFAVPTTGGKQEWNTSTFESSYSAAAYRFQGYDVTGATSHWYSESGTEWDQKALFGEFTWHATEDIDVIIGARAFNRKNDQRYIVNHPGGIGVPGTPDTGDAEKAAYRAQQIALGKVGLDTTYPRTGEDKEVIPKVSVKYNISDSSMAYILYSEGKRPGGVNRSRGQPFYPNAYEPDLMENNEIGYKTSFAEGRGRLNMIGYRMTWTDYQLEQVDPSHTSCDAAGNPVGQGDPNADPGVSNPGVCGQPWQQIVANTGNAHINGLNFEIDYQMSEQFRFGMNYEWMEAETDEDVTGVIESGLTLPVVPESKGAIWGDYTWETNLMGANLGVFRFQYSNQGSIWNNLDGGHPDESSNPRFRVPGYAIADIRLGLQSDDWEVSFFINNLTDERAAYTYGSGQFLWGMASSKDGVDHHRLSYVNRPREFGIRFTTSW
jgi:outer membrane receptor protein involved in Fe transport